MTTRWNNIYNSADRKITKMTEFGCLADFKDQGWRCWSVYVLYTDFDLTVNNGNNLKFSYFYNFLVLYRINMYMSLWIETFAIRQ